MPMLQDVDGHVFAKNSPSCGLFRVKVYGAKGGAPTPRGRGTYAAEITRRRPDLLTEESGRLFGPVLRENFVTRTYVHAHWRTLNGTGITAKSLIAFHTTCKFLLMAHSQPGYRQLASLLSDLSAGAERIAPNYFSLLMGVLSKPATRGGHSNVLVRPQGFVKDRLASAARRELAELIQSYRRARCL